jgi:hypothetical protein
VHDDAPLEASLEASNSTPSAVEAVVQALQLRVADTTINSQTLLATDYLNHFNEIVMLLEMVPDMPECLEDVKEWQPKSYPDHFRDSSFSEKDLAIEAYQHAPAEYRGPFDDTVGRMNEIVAVGIERIERTLESGDREIISHAATAASRTLQKLMDIASAIIHGGTVTMDQDEIDDLLDG